MSRLPGSRSIVATANPPHDSCVYYQATPVLAAAFEQAKATGALYLSHLGLSRIPVQVWALTDLVRLDLGHNDITELPSDIARLTKLEELWLNGKRWRPRKP